MYRIFVLFILIDHEGLFGLGVCSVPIVDSIVDSIVGLSGCLIKFLLRVY